MLDASRAVDVVSRLIDPARREAYAQETREQQEELREQHAAKDARPLITLDEARAHRADIAWRAEDIATPSFTGLRTLENVPLADIVPYIDWTFFFYAWEMHGKFPAILDHPKLGQAARELYDNALVLLDQIVADGAFTANGVYGFWPAGADGDDIVLFCDDTRSTELTRFPMLRQQREKAPGKPSLCLADFVAPVESGLADHVGAFAVTAGIGAQDLADRYVADNDDYSAIIVRALADRFAEAFAEMLHHRARRDWGYEADGEVAQDELIAEHYRGIRPAFGYPACPDHTEKRRLFDLLRPERIGITLSDHFAMMPPASVSGIYLAHPESQYFAVGKLDHDQVEDYAARKGMALGEAERWLSHNLGYAPQPVGMPAT